MVKKKIEVICDNCEQKIKVKPKEIKGYMFFKCPKCKKEYPICKISPEGLRIRKEIKKERAEYYKLVTQNFPTKVLKDKEDQIKKLLQEFQKNVTPLTDNAET